jgi:glutamine---fructose-6-phosphate transaminase (isomerizing)
MCGIIAVVPRPSGRTAPAVDLLARLEDALSNVLEAEAGDPTSRLDALRRSCEQLEAVDAHLRGSVGLRWMLDDVDRLEALDRRAGEFEAWVAKIEDGMDAEAAEVLVDTAEQTNQALVRLKDGLWRIGRDRIAGARAVATLAGPDREGAMLEAFAAIQTALSALDRLEVRGRDSAGLHVLVNGHGLELDDAELTEILARRGSDPLFRSGSVRVSGSCLSFVYKAASEVGELGDNVRTLRAAISGDVLLHRALAADGATCVVLGHTRWASVGMINEANAHPLNQEEEGGATLPYGVAALNGDVDNHLELVRRHGLRIPGEITTDAKIIPVLVAHRLASGTGLHQAFRHTVAEFDGSVAVAAAATEVPDELLLALRGSGQALYIGLAEDAYTVASEPYGLVAECSQYLRMDGEAPDDPDDPAAAKGQVVVLDRRRAGTLDGILRLSYRGTELPLDEHELLRAEITTRDIDRGPYPHYLLKEISEAPGSLRKTLRGRIREAGGRLTVALGADTLPPGLRQRLADGGIRRIFVIGQGTAAVAGMSVAAAISEALPRARLPVVALPATELSGFGLVDDMSDTLAVAISQSGTTTDTNRTVDLLRARGAWVVSIVNRRNSDLTHKSDGVLFTSDGRDVEMSVASTKAFYAQVAAGVLLAFGLAEATGQPDAERQHELLGALRDLPNAMERLLAARPLIRDLAREHAPARRHWAVVGNGSNRIAAAEIRIKLSELCYKAIACDTTEDKKHIDLSSEPLTLICAAGLTGSVADDAAKEVAIFRAHKGAPIVIASEGDSRFNAAAGVIPVPPAHPAFAYVLSTMAGHLFGYEAALAIDAQVLPLRQARAAVERVAATTRTAQELLDRLGPELRDGAAAFHHGLRHGRYDGAMQASTATRLSAAFRYVVGAIPVELYEREQDRPASPSGVVDDLIAALTTGIDELTRPVDAIKHQAKTVTVGISRSDESLLTLPLVRHVLQAGAPSERLGYGVLRSLGALDPAVAEVTGYIRYRLGGEPTGVGATLEVVSKGGIARHLRSRTERDPKLRGTKQLAAAERQVMAARGRSDGRTVIIVPEVSGDRATGLTLLHVRYHHRLPVADVCRVLESYQRRLMLLKSAVTETEPTFDEARLGELPVDWLVNDPVHALADLWHSRSGSPGQRHPGTGA